MKTLLAALLLTLSFNANATIWELVSMRYYAMSYYCTYQKIGTDQFFSIRKNVVCLEKEYR